MLDKEFYGIPTGSLSLTQLIKIAKFQNTVEPWLLDNLGKFGEQWTVEIDMEFDSLRLQFNDVETETWFKLAWLQGGKIEYEDKYKNN